MNGQEIINHIVRAEIPDMEQIRIECVKQNNVQEHTGRISFSRRAIVIVAAAVVFLVILVPVAIAYGEAVIVKINDYLFAMYIPRQTPIKGYTDVLDNENYISIRKELDEDNAWEFKGYIFDIEKVNEKYTLQNIATENGEMILLKPNNSDGFYLKEGEAVSFYVSLNLTPKNADKTGELNQIGCFLNGELYETYTGKVEGGGLTFTIIAPCDGEFMVYIINACAGMQNYAELTVY